MQGRTAVDPVGRIGWGCPTKAGGFAQAGRGGGQA